MRMIKTIDACNNCMKNDATILVINTNTWVSGFKIKLLCRKCFGIKKSEGTLYA